MTSRSQARRIAAQKGEPAPEFSSRTAKTSNLAGLEELSAEQLRKHVLALRGALRWEHQKRLDLPLPDNVDATLVDKEDQVATAQEFREGKLAKGCHTCMLLADLEANLAGGGDGT